MITHNIPKILSNEGTLIILDTLYSSKSIVTLAHINKTTTKISRTTILMQIRIMIEIGLIEKIFSKYNIQTLGYKITSKGSKCFEIYLSLCMRIEKND